MKIKKYAGYEIHLNEETGKVEYALIETSNGLEKLHPFRYDYAYNCYTNVSGYYSYRYTILLYREGEIIFR